MDMKIIKIILSFVSIVTILAICGCSFEVTAGNSGEMYSREDTKYMRESYSFGKGKGDDVYVALDHIYSDESIKSEHGDDFEITENDVICHISEGKSYFFSGLYKGQAEYSITVDESVYKVKLSKGVFGTWIVTECISE